MTTPVGRPDYPEKARSQKTDELSATHLKTIEDLSNTRLANIGIASQLIGTLNKLQTTHNINQGKPDRVDDAFRNTLKGV